MIIQPGTFADRGCWISDDRVYAFVASGAGGLTEVGYHGAQPVSRNARILVLSHGALRFAVTTKSGVRHALAFDEFEWSPGSVSVQATCPAGTIQIGILASGRKLLVTGGGSTRDVGSLVIQLDARALFMEVHGHRTWGIHAGPAGWMKLRFRDRILLDEWMKREGPYGTDFLIPERLRRTIYRRAVRSGLATSADLREEYQGASLPIYDADVRIAIGGEGYTVGESGEMFLFTAPIDRPSGSFPRFSICFDDPTHDQPTIRSEDVSPADISPLHRSQPLEIKETSDIRPSERVPELVLPGFTLIERFFSTVPGLVDSCIVSDHGVPRATPGGYYWIWAWDAMVTALVALRWGATGLARRTAEFMNAHRDDGRLPMRWTHQLEPLDTQPRGALETLLASLTYALTREKPDGELLHAVYPEMMRHLDEVAGQCDARGLFKNIGFYPDLPLRFGRTETSAVALEVAAFYACCRICENSSGLMHDGKNTALARRMISLLEEHFSETFWDPARHFFVDAVDPDTGSRNVSYPIFTLLFLQHSPALALMRPHLRDAADFIAKELLAPVGMRMLPVWDKNAGSEAVSGSWYPHWDAYAVKLLRRAGCAAEIMSWLGSVEMALGRLGYAPEYLVLDASLAYDPSAWRRHGAASNLNCVTGWYQALLEGVLGLDFDPGGLTVVPLALPIDQSAVRGVYHLGTRWNVTARGHGPWLQNIRVDGEVIPGCLKVLRRLHDGREHALEVAYGQGPVQPRVLEVTNAEVLDVSSSSKGIEAEINALGRMELVFSAPGEWGTFIDGKPVEHPPGRGGEFRFLRLPLSGRHTIHISSSKAG